MDGPARPAAPSRIDSRYRYQRQKPAVPDYHEHLAQARRDATPRSRERMTRSHRFFHRRAALGDPHVVTVEVVNKVDELGNVVAQETRTTVLPSLVPTTTVALPLPDASLPAVPSVSVVPNVPAPALPSVQVPALPSVQAPTIPAVPVPALPTVLPSIAAPQLPSVPVPALPSVPVPELPSVPVPAIPSVPVPALSNAPVATLPSVPPSVLPSVPELPSVPVPALPSVPAVPPFPTSLQVPTVPAYPFPSMFPVAHAVSASASASASSVPAETSTSAPYVPAPAPVSSIHSATNITTSSTSSLLPSFSLAAPSSISASKQTDFVVSIQAVPTTLASDLQYVPSSVILASFTQTLITSHSTRSASTASTPTTTTTTTPTPTYSSNGGAGVPGVAGAPAASTTATSGADANSSPSTLETPKVIGSVLGSLAGAALILALILLLLRRHKQKQGGALQLTGDEHANNDRSMSQAPTATSTLVPIAFLNRLSAMSGRTAETNSSAGERSFQRVSGRKLPSAFSEGMTSDQFSRGGTMSASSFYPDDHAVYGSSAMSKDFGKEIGKEIGEGSAARESGLMNIRPSPARTPIIRHPEDENPFADRHHLSPPHSPIAELPPRGTLGRSLPSADGSRSSKFTENV